MFKIIYAWIPQGGNMTTPITMQYHLLPGKSPGVPLWKLCFEGKLTEAKAALASGEDPNIRSCNNNNNNNNKSGEDPNTRTPEWTVNFADGDTRPGPVNATGLILAASEGENAIVKLLLEQPAVDPNCYVFDFS